MNFRHLEFEVHLSHSGNMQQVLETCLKLCGDGEVLFLEGLACRLIMGHSTKVAV